MAEYYMFHKPKGCITARRDPRNKTVMDYFPEEKREQLFPVGRLDKDTEGLLLVTDDGVLCHRLLSPEMLVEKTYYFHALGSLTVKDTTAIESGINPFTDKGIVTAPAKMEIVARTTLGCVKEFLSGKDIALANKKGDRVVTTGRITVTEGKKHQVKRMLMSRGCRVVYLKRISMAGLAIDSDLSPGNYRSLTEKEISILKSI